MSKYIRRVFIPQETELGPGFAPKTRFIGGIYPNADPQSFSHDVLEHVDGFARIGTVHDEFAALGAILYGRGRNSDISVSGDLSAMLNPRTALGRKTPRRVYLGSFEDDVVVDLISTSLTLAEDMVRSEAEAYGLEQDRVTQYLEDAYRWMVYGAWRAEKIYGDWVNLVASITKLESLLEEALDPVAEDIKNRYVFKWPPHLLDARITIDYSIQSDRGRIVVSGLDEDNGSFGDLSWP